MGKPENLIRAGSWTVVLTAILLTACATSNLPASSVTPIPRAAALDPESYVAFAASSALFAVRASNFAEARGSTAKLKKFASQIIIDQSGIGAQLSFAGRRVDLLPSSRPLPDHQAMLELLATSSDFDATYKAQLTKVLREAAVAHRAFEIGGSSPTLRPVAHFAAPVCEKSLAALRKL